MSADTSEPVSFETDIKPMFRDRDRGSMQSQFDLWSYDDVVSNARRHPGGCCRRQHALRRRLAANAGRPAPAVDRQRDAEVIATSVK